MTHTSRSTKQRHTIVSLTMILCCVLIGAGCVQTDNPRSPSTTSTTTSPQQPRKRTTTPVVNTTHALTIRCLDTWTCKTHPIDIFTILNTDTSGVTIYLTKTPATSLDNAHEEQVEKSMTIGSEDRVITNTHTTGSGAYATTIQTAPTQANTPGSLTTIVTRPLQNTFLHCIGLYTEETPAEVVEDIYTMCETIEATK